MVKKGKYEKYFSEVNPIKFLHFPDEKAVKHPEVNHYDYRDNEEAPHFMETNVLGSVGGGRAGIMPKSLIDPRIYYAANYRSSQYQGLPNSRCYYESRSFMSLDPEHPDDIGVTMHMWMGEGKEAEMHVIDRPATQLVPPNTVGKPIYASESHGKPGLVHVICDNPLEAFIPFRGKLPPGYENYKSEGWVRPKVEPAPRGGGKYGKYFSEIDVKNLPVYPAHRDKAARVMFYDGSYNAEAPHCINCHLVYGAGMGFGLGDEKKLPSWADGRSDESTSYEPFLPHRHPFYQTYSFSPADREKFPNLGGTVELWLGEGNEAEQHFITSATTVLIPKNTVHLPLYVREVHSPFTILTVLDTPIWAGCWSLELPNKFKL